MILLGLLLMIAAGAAVVEAWLNDSATTTTITILNNSFHLTPFGMFVSGVVTTLVFVFGILLINSAMKRSLVRRRTVRHAAESGDRIVAGQSAGED
jgi:hypothetical protein